MQKRLLVLGGSQFQIPLIKRAKSEGYFVGVFDISETAPARKYADYFYSVSLKDREAVLNAAKNFSPDGITVGMVDIAVPTCAYVAQVLNLPGMNLKTAESATDKYKMICAFAAADVPHPKFQLIEKEDSEIAKCNIDYPAIVKPIDMAGSRGIFLVHNDAEFKRAVKDSSKLGDSGKVLVEEYLVGPEVSVELIVKNGKAHAIQVTDKTTSGAPHFAETGHLQPSQLDKNIIDSVKKVACSAAESLELKNSLGHAEIKITSSGPKMIEIGARQGGDGIAEQLIELSAGVSFNEIAIRIAMGEDFSIPEMIDSTASCIRFITSKKGILSEIKGVEEARKIKYIYDVSIDGIVGNQYNDMMDNSGRIGYIIAKAETAWQAQEACDKAINTIIVAYKQ